MAEFNGTNGNDDFQGTPSSDLIRGFGGNDVFSGGFGTDTIVGGAGSDSLSGDENGDELLGGDGNDYLFGGSGFDRLSGGNGIDTIFGGEGDDFITGRQFGITEGEGEEDILWGGSGNDSFYFFSFTGGAVILRDFVPNDDSIVLNSGAFQNLPLGELPNENFALGTAGESDDRIIYNPFNGDLIYDVDGVGGAASNTFAVLPTNLQLTNADIRISS